MHLLQFCVTNQSLDSEEDALNKPWRPIPSCLMSVARARTLRWILLPSCLFLSLCLGAHCPSISLLLATLVYHELQLDAHAVLRNFCNAWGYASFNAGAAMIASGTSYVFLFQPISDLTGRTPCGRSIDAHHAHCDLRRSQQPHHSLNRPLSGFP
jgi:4-hydroxybenzoate polyprenyltransferase